MAKVDRCKAALAEAEGDIERAIGLIVARGQAHPASLAAAQAAAPPDPEEALLEAILARNDARARELLDGLAEVSPRALQAALLTGAGLAAVLDRAIPGLGAAGHATARRVGESPAPPELRGRALGRILDAMPPGLTRSDALRVGVGRNTAVATHIPGAHTVEHGDRFGAAVHELALIAGGGRAAAEVRELPSPDAALAEVLRWVGPAPAAPRALGAPSRPSQGPPSQAPSRAPPVWTRAWSAPPLESDAAVPVVADGAAWCVVRGGQLSPIVLATGEPRWTARHDELSGIALSAALVVAKTRAGLVALGRDDGGTRWCQPVAALHRGGSPVLDATRAYFRAGRGVHAVALDDGAPLWATDCASSGDDDVLLDLGERLLVPGEAVALVLDKQTGAVVARHPVRGSLAVRVGDAGVIAVAARNRTRISWLGPDGAPLGTCEVGSPMGAEWPPMTITALCARGASLYASAADTESLYCFDLDLGAETLPVVHEARGTQFWGVAASESWVFAHASGAIGVFDLALRKVAAIVADRSALSAHLVGTAGGVLAATDHAVTWYAAHDAGG